MGSLLYEQLKMMEGKYGLLTWGVPADRKAFHGVIKIVEDDCLYFKIKGIRSKVIKLYDVVNFEEKEMLPEVKDYAGKEVVHDGGILIFKHQLDIPLKDGYLEGTERRKEITLKR